MKKKILFFLVCIGVLFPLYSKQKKEQQEQKTEEQKAAELAEDMGSYGSYKDEELLLIMAYTEDGSEQHELAEEIYGNKQKVKALELAIANLNKYLANILSSSGGDPGDIGAMKMAELEAAKAELAARKDAQTQLKNGSITSINDYLASQYSITSGDPVKITTGSYIQNDTDIQTGGAGLLTVNRSYDSNSKTVSSFGAGWTTNLDQRIILGIEPRAHERYESEKRLIQALQEEIKQIEKNLIDVYKISSLPKGAEELNARIVDCQKNENEFISLKNGCSGLGSLAQTAENLYESYKKILAGLKDDYETFSAWLKALDEKKQECGRLRAENEKYYNEVVVKSDERRAKNKRVLFSGMDADYDCTGLDTLTVIDENGYPHLLYETLKDSGVWQNKDEKLISECRKTENGCLVSFYDGRINEYDQNGFVIKISDRNKNYVNISRNSDGKINRLMDSFGQNWSMRYRNNYIEKIWNERAPDFCVSYTYEAVRLKTVTDEEGDAVTMEYYEDGRIKALKKCDGSAISFTYAQVYKDGQLLATETRNEEGFEEHFEYDKDGKRAVYIDHDGNRTVYEYDQNHRTTKELRTDGTCIINSYEDADGNLTCVNCNGELTYYTYDERGNKTGAAYSDGSYESWTYDCYNQLTSYKDRDRIFYEYVRDLNGNLIEYKTGGKTVFLQQFNSMGQIISRTVYGQSAVITSYKYDENGNLISQTSGGVKTEYEYDERNRVIRIKTDGKTVSEYEYKNHKKIQKDFNGLETSYITNGRKDLVEVIQKDTATGLVHKTRIEYDRRHLPVKVYVGDGQDESLVSSYSYTPEGKLKSQTCHADLESFVTEYSYLNSEISEVKQFKSEEEVIILNYSSIVQNGGKKLFSVTDGLGYKTLFEYDSYGNLVKTTDANGEVRGITYSSAGRLKSEQSEHGGWYEYDYDAYGNLVRAGEKGAQAVSTEYYPDGSIKKTSDRYGIVTYYNYDNMGRVSCIQKENLKIWYEYDSFDRVVKQVTGTSASENNCINYITYEYSDDGKSVTVAQGGKYKTISVLDAFGNIVSQTDGNGNTRRYEYNEQNQMTASYDGYGSRTLYEYNALGMTDCIVYPDGARTSYQYNCLGQLEKITDDCGTVYEAVYDKADRLIKEKNRADSEKHYEYDSGGRITKVLCGGETVEAYGYRDSGRVVTVRDGNGRNYVYNYDAFGRLSRETNRNGLTQNYLYDEEGQLKNQTGFDGSSSAINWSSDRTVCTVSYSDSSQERFVYDLTGNITEAQNAYGKTLYRYDKGGLMIYQKDLTTGEEINFEYDGAGNRTHLYSSNRETRYSYGCNNELKEIFDNKQRMSVKLSYDKNGREVLRTFGNGTKEETLYDRAGRITVKMHKSERSELLWAQGYVYAPDGKRSATVDEKGRVTLYEYNKKGQLSAVYYPYTQQMIQTLEKEAESNGLVVTGKDLGENRYLSADIKQSLSLLMESMQRGLSFNLTTMQVFIKESYGYDRNGNRISKTTNYGTIEYTYDKENFLVSTGSRGQPFVKYTCDNAGNLLSEESAGRSTKYAYNAQNRLIYCEVTDRDNKEYAQTSYAYDAFGRRVLVQDQGQSALRTIYDGLGFDIIKTSPTYAGGLFTDSLETGIKYNVTGSPTGDRYRYLSDQDTKDDNRYFYLDENTYKTTSARYQGELTRISVNGSLAALGSSDGVRYFSTDLSGSVVSAADGYGYTLDSYSYDAFGNLIQGKFSGSLDSGYLGKQQDPTSRLYNYGYRDYQPQTARFTTLDPIRDGSNWFSYVNNDPVNFVDLWGLKIMQRTTSYVMSDGRWGDDVTGNGIDNAKDKEDGMLKVTGCAITEMSNILSTVTNKEITPQTINNTKENFSEGTDLLKMQTLGEENGLVFDYWTKDKQGNLSTKIKELAGNDQNLYISAQVKYKLNGASHWVGIVGVETRADGKTYVKIAPTSVNDKKKESRKRDSWKLDENGDMWIETSDINKIYTFEKTDKKTK